MKTNLFTKWAMMFFVAFTLSFTLAGCGEEVAIEPNSNDGRTVFAADFGSPTEDGTRTTMDKYGVFYWQFNDQIWLNEGGTWVKSSESQLTPDNKSANFYYNKLFTEDSYPIVYTGYNSTSATEVKFPAEIQLSTSYMEYIGANGDCGVATATKVGGSGLYRFELQHKSSFLGIVPLKVSVLNKRYFWTKIEITEANGRPISGTFGFSHTNGIDTTSVTSPTNKVTLVPQPNLSFNLPFQSYNSNYRFLYVSLPPCSFRLNVKYYFASEDNPSEIMTVSRQLNRWKFFENNLVQFTHAVTPDYYCWDAPKTEPFESTRRNPNAGADFVQASNSCATMPNANELYWYIVNGDPRWDNSEESKWSDTDGATYYTGGVWIKKKSVILAEGKEFSSTVGKNGVDMRTTYVGHTLLSDAYRYNGRPADSEIGKYFFLPAQGWFTTSSSTIDKGVSGYYWTSSASSVSANGVPMAYMLHFDDNRIMVNTAARVQGAIAGNGSDWFK